MRKAIRAALLLSSLVAAPAMAATGADELLTDPAKEARAREITRELRCVVCPNQSIDDSDADIARDLRLLVREQVSAGRSNQEIMAYVVDRYGDYVLLDPPFRPGTWILWLGPFVVLALGGLGIVVFLRRSRDGADPMAPQPLSASEQQRLQDLLPSGEPARADR
ncbi:cytochrome c-type biogenesis protein [Marinivivus vitaminiproducens]|uniref:cytochrome c-type biogenesis protein n=1 Tax=Marinivivus vitaminiproducens TaxID=3035935 RepID=UPI0027A1C1E1|nr:cytochrome c-type biogenesis protein CcmH [Geminicoccaceae bacterium SCSIO 64248]